MRPFKPLVTDVQLAMLKMHGFRKYTNHGYIPRFINNEGDMFTPLVAKRSWVVSDYPKYKELWKILNELSNSKGPSENNGVSSD